MSKKLIGAAGEHYIAFKLSLMGYSVALTRDGSDTIDLMVGDILDGTAVAIQVKTARNASKTKYWEWSVGRKPLSLRSTELIYVFVDLREVADVYKPDIFVVPISDIAKQAEEYGFSEHPDWNTYYFQIKKQDKEKYYEQWEFITNKLSS